MFESLKMTMTNCYW